MKMVMFQDVADWIAELVHKNHPMCTVKLIPESNYSKVSLVNNYGDYCIIRLSNSKNGYWFSINSYPGINRNDPLFDAVENKNKNHWKIPIERLNDLLPYEKYIVEVAEYQIKTYEVEEFPYDPDFKPLLSASDGGIKLQLNFKSGK